MNLCKCGHAMSEHTNEDGPCYTCVTCFEFSSVEDTLSKTDVSEDAVVEAVRMDLLNRSKHGVIKYGVTLEKSGLALEKFLQHHYEELLDAANYVKATLMKLRGELP